MPIALLIFATCSTEPDLAPDDVLALPSLAAHGFEAAPRPWDRHDASALAASGACAIVLRSCWNYHLTPEAFAAWLTALERSSLPVINPAPLARWNLSKEYLRELSHAGAPLPRTLWIAPGDPRPLAELLEAHGLDDVVLKPWVSMNGWDTWRSGLAQAARDQERWASLVASRGMMIQRYVPEIETGGELSFVFFEGEFSHALRKLPAAGEFRVQQEYGGKRLPFSPTSGQIQQAARILEAAGQPALYARVDVVEAQGQLWLMELEVIDPTLFFALDPAAAERFAAALARRLG